MWWGAGTAKLCGRAVPEQRLHVTSTQAGQNSEAWWLLNCSVPGVIRSETVSVGSWADITCITDGWDVGSCHDREPSWLAWLGACGCTSTSNWTREWEIAWEHMKESSGVRCGGSLLKCSCWWYCVSESSTGDGKFSGTICWLSWDPSLVRWVDNIWDGGSAWLQIQILDQQL